MKLISQIPGMYTVRTGMAGNKWYGAGLVLPDNDEPWLDRIEAVFFPEKDFSTNGMPFDEFYLNYPRPEDKTERLPGEWMDSVTGQKRRLVYFDGNGQTVLAEADRIYGPCIPSGYTDSVCVGWIERNGGERSLRYFDGNTVRTVLCSNGPMAAPDCAVKGGEVFFAFAQGTESVITDPDGNEIARFPGKYPRLAVCGGKVYCVYEKADREAGRITLALRDLMTKKEILLEGEAVSLHACTLTLGANAYIAYETRPSWGMDQCLTQTSTLRVAVLESDTVHYLNVPFIRMGYRELGTDDPQSIHMGYPVLFIHGTQPGIAVRRFRAEKFRANTWDVYVNLFDGSAFTPFRRISMAPGTADTGCGLFDIDGELCCAMPCHDECSMSREFHTRTEIWNTENEYLPPSDPPMGIRASYQYETGAEGIGHESRGTLSVPGYVCREGDIHDHSAYSKCSSSVDGSPDELARWYLDLMGMQVICLTDHADRIGYPQYTWLTDRIEELADGCGEVLYGIEPSAVPDHDTIYYSAERKNAELVRLACLYNLRRKHVYETLRCHLPQGSVVAIRHCHGMDGKENGIHSQATLTTHAPDLEWAMEAIQLRGNMLLGESVIDKGEHFPANFLNAGARIGLTGGTDHDSRVVVNHMGYTGFWCRGEGAESVLEALRSRRTYAVSNGHACIWTELDGKPMGSEVALKGSVEISVKLSAARRILRVALIRDGVRLPWVNVSDGCKYEGTLCDADAGSGVHWYCVTAECESVFSADEAAQGFGGKLLLGGFARMMPRKERCTVISSPYFVDLQCEGSE